MGTWVREQQRLMVGCVKFKWTVVVQVEKSRTLQVITFYTTGRRVFDAVFDAPIIIETGKVTLFGSSITTFGRPSTFDIPKIDYTSNDPCIMLY
jgi:hypothetical protein